MLSSRTKKSIVNIFAGTGYQIFSIFLNFLSRSIFIHILGNRYLGIDSLFSNVLSILSLAELGIGSAMVYCMYEPLAKHDYDKLASLAQYFKKIYRIIAFTVLLTGLLFMPFLGFIVKLENDIENLSVFYLLYLLDTVVSYLCMYKTTILTADQKNYVLQLIRASFDIIRILAQITILLFLKNYLFYLIIQIVCSICYNLFSASYVSRIYPFVEKSSCDLQASEKKAIWDNIKAMFSYKLGGVVLNNTDQLLISIFVSTECVGLYSNYYLPIKSVMGITSAVFIAVQASIGNLTVEKNQEKQYEVFNVLDFASFWIYGIFTVGFCVMLQDFIRLWIGDGYLLSNSLVYIISTTYYLTGVLYPIWCYRETVGLFKHTKNIMLYASFINILFSIWLGEIFGIEGILFATIIARVFTNIWFEPYKLFSIYFGKNVIKYYWQKLEQCLVLVLTIIVINYITSYFSISNLFVHFMVKGAICVIITNVFIIFYLWRKDEAKELFLTLKKVLLRKF